MNGTRQRLLTRLIRKAIKAVNFIFALGTCWMGDCCRLSWQYLLCSFTVKFIWIVTAHRTPWTSVKLWLIFSCLEILINTLIPQINDARTLTFSYKITFFSLPPWHCLSFPPAPSKQISEKARKIQKQNAKKYGTTPTARESNTKKSFHLFPHCKFVVFSA